MLTDFKYTYSKVKLIRHLGILSLALFFCLLNSNCFAVLADNYTKLLLHGDGASGSSDFKDDTGKTVAGYGGVRIDSFQSKFGGSSILFSGFADYLFLADSAD